MKQFSKFSERDARHLVARYADPPDFPTFFGVVLASARAAAASGDAYVHSELTKHVVYLVQKTKLSPERILGGARIWRRQVLLDFIRNASNLLDKPKPLLAQTSPTPGVAPDADNIWGLIELAEKQLQGWCSRPKAEMIVEAISSLGPEVAVEIGVFGGRSLVPAAAALRELGKGVIYGVETWSPAVATEHSTNKENDDWWRGIDFSSIKTSFLRFIVDHGLSSRVKIVELPSADAAAGFHTIDYLHIDGAHSIFNAAEDTVLYAKKVRRGGVIVLDDTNWSTTAPAFAILKSLCSVERELHDEHGNVICVLLRRL